MHTILTKTAGDVLYAALLDTTKLTEYLGYMLYAALGLIALWGAFCVIMLWRRIGEARFRNEEEQEALLDRLDESLAGGDFDAAAALCDGDARATSQLASLAIANRRFGYTKVRSMVTDRFQRDVLSDLEYRLSWVDTVIKSAPMVGLLGTVVGMMGAFDKISGGESVEPTRFAGDIRLALLTTAIGLAIAIPLVIAKASINVRIGKMEDLVGAGLTRFFEAFRRVLGKSSEDGE